MAETLSLLTGQGNKMAHEEDESEVWKIGRVDQFYQHIRWVQLIKDWDIGRPDELGLLIEKTYGNTSSPRVLREIIGNIVGGRRKPNTKRLVNLKYKPSEQIQIVMEILEHDGEMLEQRTSYRVWACAKYGVSQATFNRWERKFIKLKQDWPNI